MTILRNVLPALTAWAVLSAPAHAASDAQLDALFEALGAPELLEIMADEGLDEARDMGGEMFGGRAPGFLPIAEAIYDTVRMERTFRAGFDEELAEADIEPLLDFFQSERGRRIVGLEISGRIALADPDVEAAAEAAFATLEAEDPDRLALLTAFVEVNDLVEYNVMGALNASLAFYRGLDEGGGFDIVEEQVLSDVWASEPEIRADTELWVFSYLGMAYRPLEDADLEAYTAMSQSPEGRDLNRALFRAYDDMFIELSHALGRAASVYMTGEDL
ncbi:MAG: DUF2059 domain-containing protein [Paracoccaceae bacterium]|nr:DUF2059 domain-containing protein [Paracoccaceae bacterium]